MDNHPSQDNPRLNKYLALQLGVSRREADELIAAGSVTINDEPAGLGRRVAANDAVTVRGKTVSAKQQTLRYFTLNKPVGFVCSRRQQGDSPTIYSLLPPSMHELKPVGRLDRDSSGLLLLTNDGDFAHSMTHPKFHKTKRYEVRLDQPLQPLHQQMISDYGVALPDGISKFTVTRLDRDQEYEVVMHEGRNRQIRRTFAALGYAVTHLHRTDFGPYSLSGLAEGSFETVEKA